MTSLVVWLHGLGDTGDGWRHLRGELGLSGPKYCFPDAPIQAVTCNGGMEMTSWMDLDDIPVTPSLPDDVEGLERSKKRIHAVLDEAVASGTPSTSIVLGGFSQGAAMALLAGCARSTQRAKHAAAARCAATLLPPPPPRCRTLRRHLAAAAAATLPQQPQQLQLASTYPLTGVPASPGTPTTSRSPASLPSRAGRRWRRTWAGW